MRASHINTRHLRLIRAYATRHAIRGGSGLVFLLVAMFFSLVVAQALISPIEQIIGTQGGAGTGKGAAVLEQLLNIGRPVVQWAVGGSADPAAREWASYLLDQRPALLSILFLILTTGMPFLIPLGAFNQTAGDIGSRGIRYLLLRTERSNIFLGRFLATALFTVFVHAFSMVTIALYLGLKLRLYGAWDVMTWSLHGYMALVLLSLPYVALCSWISARHDSALLSLAVCALAIGGVLLGSALVGVYWEPGKYIKWLLPWGVQDYLLAPHWYQVAGAVAACLLYTAVYLFLGHRHFCKRDL